MELFSKSIYLAQGVRKGCAPPSVHAQPRSLACTPSPSPCVWPFPLHTSPLVPPPPLAHVPSLYAHPPWSFPLPLRTSPLVPPAPPARAPRGKMGGRGG